MKYSVFYVFMVIQAMKCDKAVLKDIKKSKMTCSHLKCNDVENPQCVRIKRHDKRLTYYVIAVSDCELQYIKCIDQLKGTIVSMKYCDHNAGRITDTNYTKNRTAHIRVKRSAIQSKPSVKPILRQAVKQEISKSNNTKHTKLKTSRANRKKQRSANRLKSDNPKVKGKRLKTKKFKGPKKHARQSIPYPFSSETETDVENNEMKKLKKGIAGYVVNVNDEEGMSPKNAKLQAKAFGPPRNYRQSLKLKNTISNVAKHPRDPPIPFFSMYSAESTNNALGKVDMMQYDEPCPTVCPSRNVMVCAQCQHGIYRSFSSVCHMRMFGCNHPEEVMSLVSRVPCVMSSPFLSEKGMQPQGIIEDHDDDDIVLRFIKCRDAGQLEDYQKLSSKHKIKKKDVPRTKGALRKHHSLKYAYNYINKFNTWYDAKFVCDHSDARLFYPRNSKEARNIYNQFFKIKNVRNPKYPDYIYVGIYIRIGRDFVTFDGKPISEVYENWAPGQPDNKNGNENCVAMNSRYEYHDVDCKERLSFICARPVTDRLRLRNSTENHFINNFRGFIESFGDFIEDVKDKIKEKIVDKLEDGTEDSTEDNDDDNDEDNVEDNDEDSVEDNVEDNDEESVEDNDEDNDEDSVEDNVEDNDEDNDEDSVEDNVEDRVEDFVESNEDDYDEENDDDNDEDNVKNNDEDNDEDNDVDNDEDNDEDNIQDYIRDPRCYFETGKESLKYYDFKGAAKPLNKQLVRSSNEY